MPTWIREQEVSVFADSPGAKVATVTGRTGKADSRRQPSSSHVEKGRQTTLRQHHFKTSQVGSGSTSGGTLQSALYTDRITGTPGRARHDGNAKRSYPSKVYDVDPNPSKKEKTTAAAAKMQRRSVSGMSERQAERDNQSDTGTPEPALLAKSMFGSPPQASLTPQQAARTPRRRRKSPSKSTMVSAPAISPSKRKALIVDSARDVAMQQQHRRSSRSSSSPLQSIENTMNQNRFDVQKISTVKLTPSKLRHGYSLLAFPDDDTTQLLVTSDCPDEKEEGGNAEEGQQSEDSPSPSAERQERFESAYRLSFTRSPRSNKRVYAQETLQAPPPMSPLDRFNEMQADTRAGEHRSSKAAEQVLDISPCGNSTSLSSPPPPSSSPNHVTMNRERGHEHSSSQTAPGGSFTLPLLDSLRCRDEGGVGSLCAYDDSTDEVPSEEGPVRRGCDDETYRLPSSQDLETPVQVRDVKRALRSNTRSTEKRKRVTQEDDEEDEGDDATQPLAWSPTVEIRREKNSQLTSKRQRISDSWKDLGKVWDQVSISQGAIAGNARATDGLHQSSLALFGFAKEAATQRAEDTAARADEEMAIASDDGQGEEMERGSDDDEEVESNIGEGEDEDAADTQALPWSQDEDDADGKESATNRGRGTQTQLVMMPDEDDFDTQCRALLELV